MRLGIRVITNGIPKVINLLELCRSPGMNLLSGPRMEAAGWGLSYKNRVFTATDKRDRLLMTVKANEKGLYFITGAPCYPNGASLAMAAQSENVVLPISDTISHGGRVLEASRPGVETGTTVPSRNVVRNLNACERERLPLFLPLPERESLPPFPRLSERESLPPVLPVSKRESTSSSSDLRGRNTFTRERHSFFVGNHSNNSSMDQGCPDLKPGAMEPIQRRPSIPQEVRQQSNLGPREETLFGVQPLEPFFLREQEYLTATDLIDSFDESPVRPAHDSSFKSYDVRGQFAAWPPCYFARECICSCPFSLRSHPSSGDVSAPAQEVARSRTLLEAHVRFGHRNFRSLAKALNLRLPAQLPFCKACVEAKATRHPKSRDPHPVRPVAVRAGARIYFDPFGPFRDRLADGS